MMYYYKRKSNPFKWVIIVLIFMALGALVYWFYFNYFSTIDLAGPQTNDNLNLLNIKSPRITGGEISQLQGDVQVNIDNKGFEKAIDKAVLHQGDGIKTGENSLAVLNLDDKTAIRLGANTEIVLADLKTENIIIELIKGRIYNNVSDQGEYLIKANKAYLTSLGTKFEVIYNDFKQYLAVLVFENKVNLEIKENEEIVMSSRLDANEKGLFDFLAAKKDRFKIETIDPKILAREKWYQWNFDMDLGKVEELPDQEPDFEVISDSLNLSAKEIEQGINLAWTAYNLDNFQSYKVIKSGTDSEVKYLGGEVVKTISVKDSVTYLDTRLEANKKYYYRICAVKTGNKVACGNVVKIETAEKDATPPTAPILSATIGVSGVNLAWSANNQEDFKEYRILKSQTDANPSFSTAGYLAMKVKGDEKYLDTEVNITFPFIVYYRVCSLDMAMNFSCSNVVTVEQGKIK